MNKTDDILLTSLNIYNHKINFIFTKDNSLNFIQKTCSEES